jgi:hypothetical protein
LSHHLDQQSLSASSFNPAIALAGGLVSPASIYEADEVDDGDSDEARRSKHRYHFALFKSHTVVSPTKPKYAADTLLSN